MKGIQKLDGSSAVLVGSYACGGPGGGDGGGGSSVGGGNSGNGGGAKLLSGSLKYHTNMKPCVSVMNVVSIPEQVVHCFLE